MVITLVISLILPVVLFIIYAVANKGKGIVSAWFLGAAGFFVLQMLIRIPILNVLSILPGFLTFVEQNYVLYVLLLGFSAGLFEVIGRFAVAKIMSKNLKSNIDYLKSLRAYAIDKLSDIDDILINGNDSVNVLNVSFKDVRGEVLLHSLEAEGIYVSTGSACNSKSTDISYVIASMDVPRNYAEGTIRISFSEFNTMEEIDYTVDKINNILNLLRRFKRR